MSVCLLTEPQLYVRFDIWEQGNVSPLQLSDKLQGALRHALCDVVMEMRVLPNPLCLGVPCPATKAQKEEAKGEVIIKWLFVSLSSVLFGLYTVPVCSQTAHIIMTSNTHVTC